jgi:hypothetical protein
VPALDYRHGELSFFFPRVHFAHINYIYITSMAAPVTPDNMPTTASYIFATAIIAGVIGYFAGQGASLGLFSSSPATTGRSTSKRATKETHETKNDDLEWEEDEDSEEEDDGAELATFEGINDEVKLVLVVRTDLGMGKGKRFPVAFSSLIKLQIANYAPENRKNRRSMLPCHPRLLQILLLQSPQLAHSQALGKRWTGQSCTAGQDGGRDVGITSSSYEPGTLRARDTGCWTDANSQWEQDGSWCFGTEDGGRSGYWSFETSIMTCSIPFFFLTNGPNVY